MNILQRVDGHKTETAGALAVIPGIMEGIDLIWNLPPVYDKATATVNLIIGVLAAFGVSHKVAKFMARRGAK